MMDQGLNNESGQVVEYESQKTLLKVSTLFLNDDLAEIDQSVNDSFEIINEFIKSDRIQVHVFDKVSNCCELSYQYCAENIPEVDFIPVPLDLINDLIESLKSGKHIFTPNTNDLPEGQIKDALLAQQTKSILIIPMRIREDNIGFISFESIKDFEKDYPSEKISFLSIYANMLANLMVRSRDREQLKDLIEKITIQNKRHSDFSFITSHNIRSSVANLMGISDLLRTDISPEFYSMLRVSIDKLNENLTNVNEILNGELGSHPARGVQNNIRSTVEKVLTTFQSLIDKENIKVSNLINSNLNVFGYPRYLENIFLQVLGNAFKYTRIDEERAVTISSLELVREIQILVVDNGKGFDSVKNSHKLFHVGSRFHAEQSDGNGLGLFMTKLQLESIGGKIEIESSERVGTTVRLIFPKGS